MKRIAAIVCALSLLLAGCSHPETPSSTQASKQTEAPQTTAAPTTAAATEQPSEPVQTEPAASTEPAAPQPAGAIQVHTDYSAYTPYAGGEVKFTRLQDGLLDRFEPSADYGGVYPFVSDQVVRSSEEGAYWGGWKHYGIIDRNGRILTDGIYSKVSLMGSYNERDDCYDCQPFWITEICDNPEPAQKLDYNGESVEVIGVDDRFGVISMDGSFALPEDYVAVSAFKEGFCCYRSCLNDQGFKIYSIDYNDYAPYSSDFEVYDGQGKLCFTGKQVEGAEGNGCYLRYGEGIYLLALESDEGREYWFLDKTGKRIAGPYAYAYAFSDGLACVSTDGTLYGYIDKTGATVIPEQYTDYSDFRDGHALVYNYDDGCLLIDRTGETLRRFDTSGWGCFVPCGVRVGGYPDYDYYDLDGNFLLHAGSNDYIRCLDEDTFYSTWGERDRIFRANGEELELNDLSEAISFWTLRDGTPAEGYCAWTYADDGMDTFFIPRDLSAAEPMEIPAYVPTFYHDPHDPEDPVYKTYDAATGAIWYLTPDRSGWNAVSGDGAVRRIPLRANSILLFGDRIMGLTDRACVYLDLEGNVIFSYPLTGED